MWEGYGGTVAPWAAVQTKTIPPLGHSVCPLAPILHAEVLHYSSFLISAASLALWNNSRDTVQSTSKFSKRCLHMLESLLHYVKFDEKLGKFKL